MALKMEISRMANAAFQDTKTKVRVGYQCSCGAVVINGLLVEHNITDMRTVRKEA